MTRYRCDGTMTFTNIPSIIILALHLSIYLNTCSKDFIANRVLMVPARRIHMGDSFLCLGSFCDYVDIKVFVVGVCCLHLLRL